MKILKINPRSSTSMLAVFVLGLMLSACQSALTPQNKKDSLLTVKTTAAPASGSSAISMPGITVTGGTVSVNSAHLNLAAFILEENSGQNNQNQQNGQHGAQDSTDIGTTEGSGPGNGMDANDIVVKGPFAVALNQDVSKLASVDVYAGVFKQADLLFEPVNAAPFNSHSIVAEGSFKPDKGNAVPFRIRAAYKQMLQIPLAGKGLHVASNSVVPVVVRFDLAKWLQNLDWAHATEKGGIILIDKDNNTRLFAGFIKNLGENTDLEKEK